MITCLITGFKYKPERGVTFKTWHKHNEDIFKNESKGWPESGLH